MFIRYPFQISRAGRVAQATAADHIEQLIEQLLFTMPGERVNRLSFGSGLMQLVFQPNNHALTTTYEYLIQGALQAYLGDLIQLDGLDVNNDDAIFSVTVKYTVQQTQASQTITLSYNVPPANN